MTHIRNTIDLLSKILKENRTTSLKAETFRLAKFDKPEAVLPLWRLLFELGCYCEYGKIDGFVLEAYNQLSSDEVVVYVKQSLQAKGYYSVDFAQLPNDMHRGSRELLLAFGWLLSSERIIEKFAMSRTSVLDDDTAGFYENEFTNDQLNSSLNLLKLPGDIFSRIKQLLWLNNKLRLNLCSLHNLQCQRSLLKHKIHAATLGTKQVQGRDHLSMLEVYLVRNHEFLKKSVDLLERDNERLRDLLTWKDHEGIFWKWMESVLEAKSQPVDDESSSKKETLSSSSEEEEETAAVLMASSRLHVSHRTLQESIAKYEAVVEHIERLCAEKSHEVLPEELDEITSRINLELSIQKTNIALRGQKNTPRPVTTSDRMPVEPRLVLEKKLVERKKLKPGSNVSRTEPQPSFTSLFSSDHDCNCTADIDDEIDRMQRHLCCLEKDLSKKQNCLKKEIERLSGKLTDAVCIPPLNRNLNPVTRFGLN